MQLIALFVSIAFAAFFGWMAWVSLNPARLDALRKQLKIDENA